MDFLNDMLYHFLVRPTLEDVLADVCLGALAVCLALWENDN